jgi:hypothetical protein
VTNFGYCTQNEMMVRAMPCILYRGLITVLPLNRNLSPMTSRVVKSRTRKQGRNFGGSDPLLCGFDRGPGWNGSLPRWKK